MVNFDLAGKKAAVTGASRGIGAAAALALARSGADVLLIARDIEKLRAVQEQVRAMGRACEAVSLDIGNREHLPRFETAARAFGGLDIFVNNAAFMIKQTATQVSYDDLENLFRTNLFGAWVLAQSAAAIMRERGGGAITFVTSINALSSLPTQAAYSATKAALESLMKSLAAELARENIRVNSVAPGAIDTDMNSSYRTAEVKRQNGEQIPMGRVGEAEDIGECVAFLCSDAARYMTGSTLVADGGYLLRPVPVKKPDETADPARPR